MVSIFSDYIEKIIEVFMDDFIVHEDSFDYGLHNLTLVLQRCIETNLVLNSEKCHFITKTRESKQKKQKLKHMSKCYFFKRWWWL